MKICIVHNTYGVFSGEDAAIGRMGRLLKAGGCEVVFYTRGTLEMLSKPLGSLRAFFSGMANPAEAKKLETFLLAERPDIVQFQNIYPVISPLAYKVPKKLGIPSVLRCSNYRLFCPTGLLMSKRDGRICEKCPQSWEMWCALKNCERSLPKSIGYGLRTFAARKTGAALDNIDMLITPSNFVRDKFIRWGVNAEHIEVVPTPVERPDRSDADYPGDYLGFVGRVSYEKGVDFLVEAHRRALCDVPMRIAGDFSPMPELLRRSASTVQWLGNVPHPELGDFYRKARIIVVPSVCHEVCPNVALEAMRYGRCVIGSRVGGIPEVVIDGATGLLVAPRDAGELAEKLTTLWNAPELCQKMGAAGLERAAGEFSEHRCYENLMNVYNRASERLARGNRQRS